MLWLWRRWRLPLLRAGDGQLGEGHGLLARITGTRCCASGVPPTALGGPGGSARLPRRPALNALSERVRQQLLAVGSQPASSSRLPPPWFDQPARVDAILLLLTSASDPSGSAATPGIGGTSGPDAAELHPLLCLEMLRGLSRCCMSYDSVACAAGSHAASCYSFEKQSCAWVERSGLPAALVRRAVDQIVAPLLPLALTHRQVVPVQPHLLEWTLALSSLAPHHVQQRPTDSGDSASGKSVRAEDRHIAGLLEACIDALDRRPTDSTPGLACNTADLDRRLVALRLLSLVTEFLGHDVAAAATAGPAAVAWTSNEFHRRTSLHRLEASLTRLLTIAAPARDATEIEPGLNHSGRVPTASAMAAHHKAVADTLFWNGCQPFLAQPSLHRAFCTWWAAGAVSEEGAASPVLASAGGMTAPGPGCPVLHVRIRDAEEFRRFLLRCMSVSTSLPLTQVPAEGGAKGLGGAVVVEGTLDLTDPALEAPRLVMPTHDYVVGYLAMLRARAPEVTRTSAALPPTVERVAPPLACGLNTIVNALRSGAQSLVDLGQVTPSRASAAQAPPLSPLLDHRSRIHRLRDTTQALLQYLQAQQCDANVPASQTAGSSGAEESRAVGRPSQCCCVAFPGATVTAQLRVVRSLHYHARGLVRALMHAKYSQLDARGPGGSGPSDAERGDELLLRSNTAASDSVGYLLRTVSHRVLEPLLSRYYASLSAGPADLSLPGGAAEARVDDDGDDDEEEGRRCVAALCQHIPKESLLTAYHLLSKPLQQDHSALLEGIRLVALYAAVGTGADDVDGVVGGCGGLTRSTHVKADGGACRRSEVVQQIPFGLLQRAAACLGARVLRAAAVGSEGLRWDVEDTLELQLEALQREREEVCRAVVLLMTLFQTCYATRAGGAAAAETLPSKRTAPMSAMGWLLSADGAATRSLLDLAEQLVDDAGHCGRGAGAGGGGAAAAEIDAPDTATDPSLLLLGWASGWAERPVRGHERLRARPPQTGRAAVTDPAPGVVGDPGAASTTTTLLQLPCAGSAHIAPSDTLWELHEELYEAGVPVGPGATPCARPRRKWLLLSRVRDVLVVAAEWQRIRGAVRRHLEAVRPAVPDTADLRRALHQSLSGARRGVAAPETTRLLRGFIRSEVLGLRRGAGELRAAEAGDGRGGGGGCCCGFLLPWSVLAESRQPLRIYDESGQSQQAADAFDAAVQTLLGMDKEALLERPAPVPPPRGPDTVPAHRLPMRVLTFLEEAYVCGGDVPGALGDVAVDLARRHPHRHVTPGAAPVDYSVLLSAADLLWAAGDGSEPLARPAPGPHHRSTPWSAAVDDSVSEDGLD